MKNFFFFFKFLLLVLFLFDLLYIWCRQFLMQVSSLRGSKAPSHRFYRMSSCTCAPSGGMDTEMLRYKKIFLQSLKTVLSYLYSRNVRKPFLPHGRKKIKVLVNLCLAIFWLYSSQFWVNVSQFWLFSQLRVKISQFWLYFSQLWVYISQFNLFILIYLFILLAI